MPTTGPPRPRWTTRAPAWVVTAAAVFVAVHAFRLAYEGSRGAALDMGVPTGSAGSYPWCIEGVIVVASTATVTIPPGGNRRRLAWLVLLGFTAVSCGANILHALGAPQHDVWSPAFAVIPPIALPLCVRLAEQVVMATLRPLNVVARDLGPPLIPGDHPNAGPGAALPGPAPTAGRAVTQPPPESRPSGPAAASGPVPVPGPDAPPTNVGLSQPVPSPLTPGDESPRPLVPSSPVPPHSPPPRPLPQSPRPLSPAVVPRPPRPVRPPVESRPPSPPDSPRGTGGQGTASLAESPDWRTSDWYAIALARGVKKSQAYRVINREGKGAVDAARRQLAETAPTNGHGPA